MAADNPEPEPEEPEHHVEMVVESYHRLAQPASPEPPYIKVDPNGDCWVWRHGLKKYIRTIRLDGT